MDDDRRTVLPPSPTVSGESLRASFARVALGNPSLMAGVTSPQQAVKRALAVADGMVRALRSNTPPDIKQISGEELSRWEQSFKPKRGPRVPRSARVTEPATPVSRRELPELADTGSALDESGRYSIISEDRSGEVC